MSIALFLFFVSLLSFRFTHELLTYLPNRNYHMDRVINKVIGLVIYSNIMFSLPVALSSIVNSFRVQDLVFLGFLCSVVPLILFYFFYNMLKPMVSYYGK